MFGNPVSNNNSSALMSFNNSHLPSTVFGPSSSSLFSMRDRSSPFGGGGGFLFRTVPRNPITVFVTDPTQRSTVEHALQNDFGNAYTVLSAPLPSSSEEVSLPDTPDGKKQMAFRLCGVDQTTIRVELDATSRRTLRITGDLHPFFRQLGSENTFSFTKTAPINTHYVVERSDIELIGGMLLLRYTLQSSMNFETIFEGR